MRHKKLLGYLSAVGAALLVLPLRSDGVSSCDNVTTSLQSTLNNPVAGDERFFTLPSGPSNVMFLLDVSGSMANLPQCGDDSWGGGTAACGWPSSWSSVATPGDPGSAQVFPPATTVTSNGSCNAIGTGSNSTWGTYVGDTLQWMSGYTPTPTYVDPGFGVSAAGLVDQPTWGSGCSGNNCLFQVVSTGGATPQLTGQQPIYTYGSWGETSATPLATGCQVATITVNTYDCSVSPKVHHSSQSVAVIDPRCQSCTAAGGPGFWFYNGKWSAKVTTFDSTCKATTTTYTQSSSGVTNTLSTNNATVLFTGAWLNANPPKFMSARNVIKKVAWIDPGVSKPSDQLRLGLSYVSGAISSGAAIVVPLGPSTANSYPVNSAAFVTARQSILDALNHRNWPSGVTLPSLTSGSTPTATALFHVGQYFTQPGTYSSKFGSSYELNAFKQTVSGLMQASWVNSSSTSICWSCQKSSIIIVTDGSPNSESGLPSTFTSTTGYADNQYKMAMNCGPGTSCSSSTKSACCSPSDSSYSPPSPLPRVAAWLDTNDLRTSDLNGTQLVSVSPVSFNLPPGNARTILSATANMSGGTFNNVADGSGLAAAVAQALNQVSDTPTSFGAPAATALTTINAVDTKAFLTRFRPNQKATWEGHVYEWMLFDEAAAGCNPAKKPSANDVTQQVLCRGKTVMANFNGDTTPEGYNVCSGSFLVDADCDQVTEDPTTGKWTKTGSGGTPAHMFWDAGQVLSTTTATGYRTAAEHADTGNIAPVTNFAAAGATPRNIWTALPDGTLYELETKNAATLAPYMNLSQSWCSSMEAMAKLCGASPLPTCPAAPTGTPGPTPWLTYCAQQVILFARGWDVMDLDGDGCAGPGNPSNPADLSAGNTTATGTAGCAISKSGTVYYAGEERDRANDATAAASSTTEPVFYKLADVFHSSPVLVHAPSAEAVCSLGTENQCVRTVFGGTTTPKYMTNYQTPLDTYSACTTGAPDVDAYRAWRTASSGRESAVLVGSNDGLLHAFDAGAPYAPLGPDGKPQTDIDCVGAGQTDGTGEELWAFVPPDLLPRLKDTLLNHQYMVDGNVMARDVWVDGIAGTGNSLDGKKQKNEFRTVAVVTERAGGTQFTALDVTSSFDTDRTHRPKPTLLWTFPPPRSDDAQYMGQSWSDFSPRPPPIGPVRLVPTGNDKDPQGKGWIEKWAVMVNGGYDPTLTRGRAVWMVDAWTGSVLWRFTDTDFKTKVLGSSSNTTTSMFPVPAAVGLVDIGDPSVSGGDSDNFFDTATWGDMGGNLFVARFDQPGVRDSTGRVTNWRAGRAFEESRRTDDAQYAGTRTEFFYMTANTWEPQRRALRTLLGAGNREQILEQGQTCAPDNLFSCCQAGCSVSSSSSINYGVCSSSGSFSCSSSGQMTSAALTEGCGTAGASACTGGSSNQFTSSSSYTINCGSAGSTAATGSATCDATGLCTVNPVGTGHDVTPSSAGSCTNKARFYGIWSYGGLNKPKKAFSTVATDDWTTVQTFDQNRFTDVANYAGCTFTGAGNCSLVETTQAQVSSTGAVTCADGSSSCMANADDPGWFYQYNTGPCPTVATCSSGCTNEKTASGATILNSCGTWNSFLPLGTSQSGSSTNPCATAGTAIQTAIGYASNFVTGVPDAVCNEGTSSTAILRGQQRTTIAPPSAPMVRMGVSKTGQVNYSALQLDPGSAPNSTSLGQRDLVSPMYWLELSRQDHACRHQGQGCR